jgi:hypothetical protein
MNDRIVLVLSVEQAKLVFEALLYAVDEWEDNIMDFGDEEDVERDPDVKGVTEILYVIKKRLGAHGTRLGAWPGPPV